MSLVMVILHELLAAMIAQGASDLHLAAGRLPRTRVDGRLAALPGFDAISQEALEQLLCGCLDEWQQTRLQVERELDFGLHVDGIGRFRGNAMWHQGELGAVFRAIPGRALTLQELGLPGVLAELACRPRGLVLVTGPTGSGKSTTLAAMIDFINTAFDHHIVTIEDPTEFVHADKRGFVRQRELGRDTQSFAAALRHVLRQDPDVILVGEMRDLETISLAVTAAETGHLVFGTLHTSSATSTIDRVIDVFPAAQQQQIRTQLASTLEGIVSQILLPRATPPGRVCAMEILVATHAVRNMIREAKTHQLNGVMMSSAQQGMRTLNMALKQLVDSQTITADEALSKSASPDELQLMLGR